MSVMQGRGGYPAYVARWAGDTTGRMFDFKVWTTAVYVRNTDTNVANFVKMYFTLADFTAGTNYLVIPATTTSTDGTLMLPLEVSEVWLQAAAGTPAVEICAFQRRG